MSLRDTTYKLLPLPLQNVAISIFGYLWQKRRFGGVFLENVSNFKDRERFTSQQWIEYQNTELRKLLIHSYKHVPYYNKLFQSIGLNMDKLKTMSIGELKTIPMLEKDTLRQCGKNDLLSDVRQKNGMYFSSSGSTGTPIQVLISHNMHQIWSAAFEVRIRYWAGIDYKTPRGMIGGRRVLPNATDGPPYYRYNSAEKQVYYSAYHISHKTVYNYVEGMKKYGIQFMNGYAVSNYLLAYFIQKEGLEAPKLKAVITSSEKLTPEMRAVMEEVYQCKTYDSWSGVEACALVSECEYGSLHVSQDVGIIEILDENGHEVAEGETGEVVCTGFLNYDQPLIRYRIGDRMTKGSGTCQCGRNLSLIQEIEGRLEDVITGPDGRQMVRFHGIFIGISSIERAQVIQHALDYIEIKIQNEVSLKNEEIALIQSRVISQLGDIQVVINQQTNIEQTTSGKFKAVISNLNKSL